MLQENFPDSDIAPRTPSGGRLLGVRLLNGQVDLSHAAHVQLPVKGQSLESTVQPGREKSPVQEVSGSPLGAAVERARAYGMDEPGLQELIHGLRMDDKPSLQRLRLLTAVRQQGLRTNASELLAAVRGYKKEQIKATEHGPLYHYHQTSLDNLSAIVHVGGLLSYNAQKELAVAKKGAGSRPDVVQFTRDHYDRDGHLVKPGLVGGRTVGGSESDVALIFEPTIMDTPGYDGIVEYPNAPSAPTSLLSAVAVAREQDIPHVQAILAAQDVQAEVVTRQQWVDRQLTTLPQS